jgi:hypothetical protein
VTRQIDGWFRSWRATGHPAIRERIILAHLGLAERPAEALEASLEELTGVADSG